MLAFGGQIEKTVGMRGTRDPQLAMLTTLSTEELIPAGHPIRRIRRVVEDVLVELDGEFDAMYSTKGRRSVPPEALLKATVLMALYSIRSERAFCERLNYDLLFKWFLDLPIDAKAFDSTTFTKNRARLLDHDVADRFFEEVVRQAKLRRLRVQPVTSPSTAPCWRRGRRTRASSPTTPRPRMATTMTSGPRAATARSTGGASGGRTRHTPPRQIPRLAWLARA